MTVRFTLAQRFERAPRRSPLWTLILAVTLACGCRTTSRTNPEDGAPSTAEAGAEPAIVGQSDRAGLAKRADPPERSAVTTAAVTDLQVAFKQAIAAAGPAVVSIYSTKTVQVAVPRGPFGGDPMFERMFEMPPGQMQEFTQRGLGSGFIFDDEGHILTNNHVIEGADEIRVKLADDREFVAKLIGSDPPTDLALLQVEAEDLEPVEFGDSDILEVGDWIVAIGDAYGLPQTVSVGIVSAKGRADVGILDFEDFIQTDAAVNPGNSGGPIVNLDGRVVGVSTAIASRGGGSEGIAFAIPINMARAVIDQLLSDGKVTRGHLGVLISPLSEELAESFGFEGEVGILVQDVVPGGAAGKAGIVEGDIITRVDGEPVAELPQFRAAIANRAPGATINVEVWRAGKAEQLEVELGEAPSADQPRPEPAGRVELGVVLENVTPKLQLQYGIDEPGGVVITAVAPGSPAERVELQPGDVLEQVGDEPVSTAQQAARMLRDVDLREGVRLRVSRGGVGRFVYIKAR